MQLNEDKVKRVEKPANQSFIFLTVGRLVRVKNIEMQIRTLAQLGNRNWGLWIVGDGSEKNALSNLAYKLGVAEKIKFFGQQDHSSLFRLYQLADCFLLTSLEEGWGLAVAEAAYFGLPIIMTDVGCAGEFIKDNYNGRVIKPGDHADLLKVVEEIIRDKDLSLRLGENAKQSFKDLPNQEVVLELYLKSWKKARL